MIGKERKKKDTKFKCSESYKNTRIRNPIHNRIQGRASVRPTIKAPHICIKLKGTQKETK